MAAPRRGNTRKVAAAALLACLSMPLHAQSRFSGEVALASQLVDQGLAITPATPVVQGSVSWMSPEGWSWGLAGGWELRSPGQPVVVLGRVSRFWSLSGDWLAQASLLHYEYRAGRGLAIPDRTGANLYFSYRDTLSIGVSAMHPDGDHGRRLLGAADLEVRYPLARHVSVSAGGGIAEAVAGSYAASGHGGYYVPRRSVVRYVFGSVGLAWHDGPLRFQLDRNLNSLGERRVYGTGAPADWVATVSWSF